MMCAACGERDAVVHLTQIVDGTVTQLDLCERCAAEKGVEPQLGGKTPLGGFLAAMGSTAEGRSVMPALCPVCGATLQSFRDTGRLGCADCWTTFEPQLRELVRRLHGSTYHVGERYAATGAAAPDRQAHALREQLRDAIEAENFELAAELRDQLRGLE